MDIKLKVLLGFLTTSFSVGTCYYGSTSDKNLSEKFKNQIWVNRMPKDETDMINIVAFVDESDEDSGLGVNVLQSVWHLQQDILLWERSNDQIDTFFPQYGMENELGFKVSKCQVEEFDLCLDFSFEQPESYGGWQNKRFYSRTEWVIENQSELTQNKLMKIIVNE